MVSSICGACSTYMERTRRGYPGQHRDQGTRCVGYWQAQKGKNAAIVLCAYCAIIVAPVVPPYFWPPDVPRVYSHDCSQVTCGTQRHHAHLFYRVPRHSNKRKTCIYICTPFIDEREQ